MEADALRRKLHPEGVVTYIVDRNINYTNFCTEYCSFCAFYRPLKGKLASEGYILDFETIYQKIAETVEMGGTGVLMQGGLHPGLKIEWFERLLRGIESGAIRVVTRELTQPSLLALEVLSARPYAYLDDAPLEERRTQAVMARRWISPQDAADIGRFDREAFGTRLTTRLLGRRLL